MSFLTDLFCCRRVYSITRWKEGLSSEEWDAGRESRWGGVRGREIFEVGRDSRWERIRGGRELRRLPSSTSAEKEGKKPVDAVSCGVSEGRD